MYKNPSGTLIPEWLGITIHASFGGKMAITGRPGFVGISDREKAPKMGYVVERWEQK